MRTLFHIADAEVWEHAKRRGFYEASSLKEEGFIHLSRPHQLLGVANRFFKGTTGLVLLQICQDLLEKEPKYEKVDGDHFPHLYGSLNISAVIGVFEFKEESDGYQLPSVFSLIGDILIRKAASGDEAEITSCHTHTWQESYRGIVPDQILDKRPLSFRNRLQWWRAVVSGATPTTAFVAESSQHGIVGFCAVERGRDENLRDKGEILAIYCFQEYKGKGVGRTLFNFGVKCLKDQALDTAYLWVLKDNLAGINFYRKLGGQQMLDEKTVNLGVLLIEVGFEWRI